MLIDDIQQNFSSFSPGFWIFTGTVFKIDEQMKKIFHFASNEIELEDFLKSIDKKSADFMRSFLASSEINILNLKVKTIKNTDSYLLIQGSADADAKRAKAVCRLHLNTASKIRTEIRHCHTTAESLPRRAPRASLRFFRFPNKVFS